MINWVVVYRMQNACRNVLRRDVSLDIIRITALFCVISVHFFKDNEFYDQIVIGERMYAATIMRTAFMVCVPLFIVLTGYLMNQKKISKHYYLKLVKVIETYILASVICYFFKINSLGYLYTIKELILGILDFSMANYSWYIEMYIGLYLIIPFLNILYNNLNSKKEKGALLVTLLILTSFPGIVNINRTIFPDWWVSLYPITYYFIGCYIYEFFDRKMEKKYIVLYIFSVLLIGTLNYYLSYGSVFIKGTWQTWGAMPNVIMTVLLFKILLSVKYDNWSEKVKKYIRAISNWCLGAYLLSYIFDATFYPILNLNVPNMVLRLEYYIIIVPVIFICSLLLAGLVNYIQLKFHNLLLVLIKSRFV